MEVDQPVLLTPREEKFVLEYPLCGFNATEAAIRAGYSPKHAKQAGYKVLKKIKPILEARQQAKSEQQLIEQRVAVATATPPSTERTTRAIAGLEKSLEMVTALAFYDPRKLFEGNNLRNMDSLSRTEAVMVTAFDIEENFVGVGDKAIHTGYTKKVKLVDRAPYLNMLLKWHRAFAEKAPPKAPVAEEDLSNWTTEDFEAYQKLKAKLKPQVIDAK